MSRVTLITCDICKREIREGQEIRFPEVRIGHEETRWHAEQEDDGSIMVQSNFIRELFCFKDVCEDCYANIKSAIHDAILALVKE